MPRTKKVPIEKVEITPHILTDSDIANNPELKENDLNAGDEIGLAISNNTGLKTEFTVCNSTGGVVRTYSLADHGENAEALAHQFASKIGGSVV